MQLFATFVKNKCTFFNFLVQQKLALLITLGHIGEDNYENQHQASPINQLNTEVKKLTFEKIL